MDTRRGCPRIQLFPATPVLISPVAISRPADSTRQVVFRKNYPELCLSRAVILADGWTRTGEKKAPDPPGAIPFHTPVRLLLRRAPPGLGVLRLLVPVIQRPIRQILAPQPERQASRQRQRADKAGE